MLSDEFISLSETYIVKSDRLKKTEIAKSYFADAKFCLRF